MVHYTDKIVGRIANKLRELEIAENTLIIFTGDNGTHPTVFTNTVNGKIQGGKGSPTNAGTLVPLVISWPEMIQSPQVHEELVEFNDFFATMADITEQSIETEGHSFKNLLTGNTYEPRKTAVVHYKPDWGKFKPTRFVRTKHYKLYEQGAFYNLQDDPLEQNELTEDQLNEEQQQIKQMLKDELTALPAF